MIDRNLGWSDVQDERRQAHRFWKAENLGCASQALDREPSIFIVAPKGSKGSTGARGAIHRIPVAAGVTITVKLLSHCAPRTLFH